MLDDVRGLVRAGMQALAAQGPDEVAATLIAAAQAAAEQFSSLAAGLLERSAEARSTLAREVRDLVDRQVQELGLLTRQDLKPVLARLDALEGGTGRTSRTAKSPRTSSARASRAKSAKPAASTAKPPRRKVATSAPKPTARRTGRRPSGGGAG